MKTNKLFFLFVLFLFACSNDPDEEPIIIVCPGEISPGNLYVALTPDELTTFDVINSNDFDIKFFCTAYYDSEVVTFINQKFKGVVDIINQENPYLRLELSSFGISVYFSTGIQEKENQEKWKLLKEEYKLVLREDAFLYMWYEVPDGIQEEWVDKLKEFPNVVTTYCVYNWEDNI